VVAMSVLGDGHKLALPGLLSALLTLGVAPGVEDAKAASLHRSASSLVLSKMQFAQAADQEGGTVAPETSEGGDEPAIDDVPFSELNEALSAARSRLTELTKAAEIAKVAGELREKLQTAEAENRQLKSVLSQLQTEFSNLQSAKQVTDGQLQDLQKINKDAVVEATRLDEELASMRWQNSQLSNSLAEAETASGERADELTKIRDELNARAEALTAAADESAGEITRLQRELDAARQQIALAEGEQVESDAELSELRQIVTTTTEDSTRLAQDLDGTITELADTRSKLTKTEDALQESNIALESAQQEAGVLREQLASNRTENQALREELQTAQADLQRFRTLNASLEQQVGVLRSAAGEATNAARQNLLAVEDQINEINAALASVKAEDLLEGSDGAAREAASVLSADTEAVLDGWVPRPSPPRDELPDELIAVVATESVQASPVVEPPVVEEINAPQPEAAEEPAAPAINLASLTTDLPASERQSAEQLLGVLKAEKDLRGLSMTVPGELLFAVNSEQIEPAAFDALSNVARLVNLYDQRDVLIVGHTDAVGDAGYNQRLSERRAELVREFFVENFEISAERLQIEGKGEQEPINTNATADGRNANRRVEVVILD
ncbi:MAG: OmpA family protein, partial [Geminicoccaceae bacterium]